MTGKIATDLFLLDIKLNQVRIEDDNVRNSILSIIGEKGVMVFFEDIDYPIASSLVPVLRKQNIDFKLCVRNIKLDNFKKIVKASID